MPITNAVSIQKYSGSLLSANLLSGNATNLVLSAFGATSASSVTDNNNVMQVNETVMLAGGRAVTVLGSGTVQPGVNLLGLTVPLGTAKPVVFVADPVTGERFFLYPEGPPNLVGAIALVVTVSPVNYSFPGGVLCFVQGTAIATPRGDRPVQALRRGQRVMTADSGPRRIMLHAVRHIGGADLTALPHLWPVQVPAGALENRRALVVSPQHRLVVRLDAARDLFGTAEVLVAAVHLVGWRGIVRICPPGGVTYHHLLLSRHEILFAEGQGAESLFTGPETLRNLPPAAREELAMILPDAAVPARHMLRGADSRALLRLSGGGGGARQVNRPRADARRCGTGSLI